MYDTAIIIPHYNDMARLTRCLDALMPQVAGDIEVVVADNGSTESLDAVCETWPAVRIVHQPEQGAGLTRNAGVAATSAPWIMFLDADCVPSANWVETGRRIRQENVITGGPVELFDETAAPKSGAEAFETVFAFQVERYLSEDGFLASAQLVLTRAVFEDVGGFRSNVAEDNDWCHRATTKGYKLVLENDFRIAHPTRSDWPALLKKWNRMVVEMYQMYGQGGRGRVIYVAKALLMPLSALIHAPRVLTHPDLTPKEKGRGLTTLIRIRFTRMIWMLRQVVTGRG